MFPNVKQMKEDYHMKNKLLVTTALVGLAFASSAMAADITTNEQLSEYAAKAEAHNWQENVTIDAQEDESLKIEQNYIEAKELNINSDVEISGQGVFLSGDNATNVAKDATVTITNKGHLLSAYDLDHNNRAVNIDGTVKLNEGAIRAASSADGTHYSQINVNGTVAVEGKNNTIASRVTNVKDGGKITIAKDSSLDLVGDMTRDPATGFVSTDEEAKKAPVSLPSPKAAVLKMLELLLLMLLLSKITAALKTLVRLRFLTMSLTAAASMALIRKTVALWFFQTMQPSPRIIKTVLMQTHLTKSAFPMPKKSK